MSEPKFAMGLKVEHTKTLLDKINNPWLFGQEMEENPCFD